MQENEVGDFIVQWLLSAQLWIVGTWNILSEILKGS